MGKRGPRKAPTTLKLLHGTHRVDRDGDPACEPKPAKANLTVPENLGPLGQEVWSTTSVLLDAVDVVTQLDLLAFHTYCRAHDEIAKCDEILAREGETFTTDKGTVCQHPMVNQRFKWLDIKRRYEAEFGMTPSSRSGIHATKRPANKIPKRKRA